MSTTHTQLPLTVEVGILVERSKQQIEADLAQIAPSVRVTASQMDEDGYYLLLDGEVEQVFTIVSFWASSK